VRTLHTLCSCRSSIFKILKMKMLSKYAQSFFQARHNTSHFGVAIQNQRQSLHSQKNDFDTLHLLFELTVTPLIHLLLHSNHHYRDTNPGNTVKTLDHYPIDPNLQTQIQVRGIVSRQIRILLSAIQACQNWVLCQFLQRQQQNS
jgi:hypothetical protein